MITRTPVIIAALAIVSFDAAANCWPSEPFKERNAAELTACLMAKMQQCEEKVPDFKKRAGSSRGLAKFKRDPRYLAMEKTSEFAKFRKDSLQYLAANSQSEKGCKDTIEYLEGQADAHSP